MDTLISIFTDTSRLHHKYHHTVFESFNLHRGQGRLFDKLEAGDGISQKELARRMNITPATLTRMVQNMERHGLVTRITDSKDQRITLITITEKGLEIKAKLNEKLKIVDGKIFKNFTQDEKDLLENMLIRIQNQLKMEIENENNN